MTFVDFIPTLPLWRATSLRQFLLEHLTYTSHQPSSPRVWPPAWVSILAMVLCLVGCVVFLWIAWAAMRSPARHVVQDYCERAGMRPTAEAPGVLQDLAIPEGRRRPADLLVCHGAGLADRLPDGSQPHHLPQTALDIAVTYATGPSHWPKTFESPGAASSAYAASKRAHQQTAAKCAAAGVFYQPLVFEAQGGLCSETGSVLHALTRRVGAAEECDSELVFADMVRKIAIVLCRAAAGSLQRRRRTWFGSPGTPASAAAVAAVVS